MNVLLRFQSGEIKKMCTFAIFQSEEIKKMWTFSSPQPKIYHNIFCHIIHMILSICNMKGIFIKKGQNYLYKERKGQNYV